MIASLQPATNAVFGKIQTWQDWKLGQFFWVECMVFSSSVVIMITKHGFSIFMGKAGYEYESALNCPLGALGEV